MILRRPQLQVLLLFILPLLSFVSAGKPTSFCKCTCWTNSTIIPLGPPGSVAPLEPQPRDTLSFRDFISSRDNAVNSEAEDEAKDHGGRTCNDCNRRFCLDQHLPKCKGAVEENVVTTCFQRDSNKDKAVVFIFIIATASLLAWAAVKPWAETWIQRFRERRSYLPISSEGEGR
ncbi:hypothetical protein MGYG_08168 [Nannizzia gypsea CBS 118893]|uniref:Uncharacterized protein n=1 Tax=Arthroderma gypseum (strain ATCC MYA-4604 / CBS 118893) TaxID=535722 RepID=E4V581_ARTGP|nr:hypothetical protein MGYG_08168 [Nannizzia gypsea CBS 118893]EFR05155.1 hypothetical protein MGYG_08168 [Nannizzia gypsea CBS 118893]